MSEPRSTVNSVRLPIDEVIDRVYGWMFEDDARDIYEVFDYLSAQTPLVVSGVLRKHRAMVRSSCPHSSATGIDTTYPLDSPTKIWRCDGCGVEFKGTELPFGYAGEDLPDVPRSAGARNPAEDGDATPSEGAVERGRLGVGPASVPADAVEPGALTTSSAPPSPSERAT